MSALKQYKAFISYRHLPLDLKVAKKLHRTIEHYVIPKALRNGGGKKIGYVFRDQDELPISSDLSGSIRTALDNSEYLIVICSPETAKSVWVLEEITYFLQTHDRDHVLAVLISGEPYESFPPMLTEPITEEDGTVRHIEPLAANIVADSDIKRNRLFKTEVLRILAVLIGCSYDDLYKREQRYRIRRITAAFSAVFAVAAAFIGMLLNKNAEINSNYEKALRNQSEYLAAESMRLYDADDRFSAIRLALSALPSEEEPDRPVVSKAVYALEQASLAYYSPSMSDVYPCGTLVLSSEVDKMELNDSGTLLFALTEDGVVSVWDTQEKSCLFSVLPSAAGNPLVQGTDCGTYYGYHVLRKKDMLLLHYQKVLFCLDPVTGNEIWRLSMDELPDISAIAYGIDTVYVSYDEETLLLRTWDGCYVIDSADGKLNRSVQGLSMPSYFYDHIEFEGDRYVFCSYDEGFRVFDSVTGEMISETVLERDNFGNWAAFVYLEDEGTVVFCDQLRPDSDYYLDRNYRKTACAIDIKTGKILWRWDSGPEMNYGKPMNRVIDYGGRKILAYTSGNMVALIDASDGSTIDKQAISSNVAGMTYFEDTGALLGYTSDGQSWSYAFRDEGIRDFIIIPYLSSEIECAELRHGGYWVLPPYSQTIIVYQYFYGDESWQFTDVSGDEIDMFDYALSLTGSPTAPVFGKSKYVIRESVAYIRDREDASRLVCVSLPRTLPDTEVKDCMFTGYTEDSAFYLWTGTSSYEVIGVDGASCETRSVATGSLEDMSLFCSSDTGLYAVTAEQEDGDVVWYAVSLNPYLHVEEKVMIGSFPDGAVTELCCIGGDMLMAYAGEEGGAYVIDMERRKAQKAPDAVNDTVSELISAGNHLKGRVMRSGKDKVFYINTDDIKIHVIPESGSGPKEILAQSGFIMLSFLSPDGKYLLTLESDSNLRRYDAQGNMLSSSNLRKTISNASEVFLQHMDEDKVCISMNGDLRIVSCEDWDLSGGVYSCLGYSPADDRYVCTSYQDSKRRLGYFPVRSLTEMIGYGNGILDGWDLPDDVRKRYGID